MRIKQVLAGVLFVALGSLCGFAAATPGAAAATAAQSGKQPAASNGSKPATAAKAGKAATSPAKAAPAAAAKKAVPSLKDLEGVWQADINATAKHFKIFPTELKNSLSGATFTISAANSRMQLKWADGTTLNRSLKLISVKNKRYNLKVDGQYDLIIDAGQKDTLTLVEEPNSIVLKRVPPAAKKTAR